LWQSECLAYEFFVRERAVSFRRIEEGHAEFESATQFNREYSRFFGQPPMRDIRALRSSGVPVTESIGRQTSAA
jgi:hypothetical protein